MRTCRICWFLWLLGGLLCGGNPGLSAQEVADPTVYQGPYRVGELRGTATYAYRTDGPDTLLTDTFRLQGVNPAALLDGSDSYFSVNGAFADGVATGNWTFAFGDYALAGSAEVVDYRYRVEVNGSHHTARGQLSAGRYDGAWVQETQRIVRSEPTDRSFRSEITFAAGVPRESFQLEREGATLLGRFKRDGLAHDAWTYYADLATQESWTFRDGRLVQIVRSGEEQADTLPVLEAFETNTRTVNLDGAYFEFLTYWLRINGYDTAPATGPVAQLLTQNAAQYARIDRFLSELGNETAPVTFGVEVPDLPLTPEEAAQLDALVTELNRIDTVILRLADNSAFTMLETADPEIVYLRTVLREIGSGYLASVRELATAHAAGVLAYLPRRQVYRSLWPSGAATATIQPTREGTESLPAFTGPDAGPFNIREQGLVAIMDLTAYAGRSVDSIRTILNTKLDTRERRQVITALDDQLMYDFTLLDSLINAQDKRVAKDYGLDNIRSTARRALRQYAEDDDLTFKQDRARELNRCIEALDALTLALTKLPERTATIEELYTDQVWNNFTATVMEERLQKRVTEAYEKLIPYFQKQVRKELNCATARQLTAELNGLHKRMLALRGTDTDDLEDELKRTDDPRRLLDLLGVTLQQK